MWKSHDVNLIQFIITFLPLVSFNAINLVLMPSTQFHCHQPLVSFNAINLLLLSPKLGSWISMRPIKIFIRGGEVWNEPSPDSRHAKIRKEPRSQTKKQLWCSEQRICKRKPWLVFQSFVGVIVESNFCIFWQFYMAGPDCTPEIYCIILVCAQSQNRIGIQATFSLHQSNQQRLSKRVESVDMLNFYFQALVARSGLFT